ncbi:hypothetical protein PT974_03055 [Cladobotryum mycophilum]|uniref:Zn(2)-C6 fungal-type domain-containing protein n=1 Tax=Cladobotryum mycophilum TaxID=491253 RepID=A0ABR0SWY6_9HYPO
MVGIGGRSRGCKTCRRARVKCDESRPVCYRCLRLKIKCDGFNPFPVFIDGLSLVEIQSVDQEPKPADENAIRTLPPRNLHINQDDIFMVHLQQSLFATFEKDLESNGSDVSPWLKMILQPNNQNRTPELAVRACAAAHYGKLHLYRPASERGTKLYTRILRHLQRDLFDHNRVLDTTTLSTTIFMALSSSEDLTDTRAALIESYSSQPDVLFKQCFLEEHAWKTVPWAIDPDPKTIMNCLLDLFCDVPGILQDIHHAQIKCFSAGDWPTTSVILEHRIKALIEELYNWRTKWEERFAFTYFNTGLDTLKKWNVAQIDTYPFPTAVLFTDPERVTEICLYNAVLMILYRVCSKLPRSNLQAPPANAMPNWSCPSILLAPGQGSMQDIVGEFCRMVYYQLLSYPGHSGAIQLIFPLQVAYRNASPGSDEAQWLASMISHVADGHGFEAVRYSDG